MTHKTATYVVQDLCLHEEYVESLRQEIQKYTAEVPPGTMLDVETLPLLDSFIKESIRCSNVDASKYLLVFYSESRHLQLIAYSQDDSQLS